MRLSEARTGQNQGGSGDKAIVFSRPNQIAEIMREVERLRLPALIRYSRVGKAIRTSFGSFYPADQTIALVGISAAGLQLLEGVRAVKIEFILLSKKIVFVSTVVQRSQGGLVIKLPEKIMAIERRMNVRFKVPDSLCAFISFPHFQLNHGDLDAPFYPQPLRSFENSTPLLRIDDVSIGGVAGFTRFGAVNRALKFREGSQSALLWFPAAPPVEASVSIRWSKKTSVQVEAGQFEGFRQLVAQVSGHSIGESLSLKDNYYRLGIQFSEVSSELNQALRSFVKKVQQADTV